jgi:hypothetical protein
MAYGDAPEKQSIIDWFKEKFEEVSASDVSHTAGRELLFFGRCES